MLSESESAKECESCEGCDVYFLKQFERVATDSRSMFKLEFCAERKEMM